MTPIDREDIHIISRNSNWPVGGVQKVLKQQVYNGKKAWQQFLQLLFLGLGIGFATAGVIFFFAYNWDSLHKFVKIGLIEGLVILLTLIILFARFSSTVKNILLTGAAVLVGVLFAVFGQVYQTGANAYDLFLGWTLSITLWAIMANYAPLWLVYLVLINTTLYLYTEQVAKGWSELLVNTLLFLINSAFLLLSMLLSKTGLAIQAPHWFRIILVLGAVTLATIGMIGGIFSLGLDAAFYLLLPAVVVLYAAGILYGIRQKSLFYLSTICFSIIIILSACFLKLSDEAGMLLFTALFILGSVTFLIKKLVDLQKQWAHEKGA